MARGSYAPMRGLLIEKDGSGFRREERRYFDVALREKLKSWKSTALVSFTEELAEFLQLIDGKPAPTIADGYAGLRSIELAAAVRASAAGAGVVRLAPLGRMPAVSSRSR
jgi:predicted dehydrogenase